MINAIKRTLYVLSGLTGIALIIPNPALGAGYILISWTTIYIIGKGL